MPYSSESKEKEIQAKETERDNAGQVFQRVSQGGVGTSPPDEGGDLSAGSNNGRLFAFIRETHLVEAQEFRLKGYNSQVPEIEGGLLTQLRDDLAATKSRLCLQVSVGGALSSLWLLDQIGNIERLTSKLSDDVIKRWVEHELPRKGDGEATEAALGNRRTAQSLARRLESTLQTLIRVVRTLRAMDDYSPPEKRHDMLVAELTGAFSSSDKSTVIQALGSMTAETSGHAAWVSLMQVRAAAWEAGKSSSVNAMIAASRHEAEKANKKARQLQGDSQTFFSHVAAYLQSLSSDLAKASIHAGLSTTSPAIPQVNNDEAAASLSRSNSLSQRIKTGFDKKKLQAQTAVAGMIVHAHRLVRITQHGHPTGTPTKAPEHVVADSIIRSILWQWQQPAIKIQYVSAALLSKVDKLKKIEGILASYSTADGRGSEQERRNTPVSPSDEEDLVAQVREWVSDSLEQENPENQRAVKVVTLEQLLGGDIDHAQSLLARLGSTTDSIQKALERQWISVNDMLEARLPVDIARSLLAKIDHLVDKLMPDMARELATAAQALNDATLAAGNSARNFSEAKVQAGKAQLLATKVKERLSAESARLTERPLDEHSRGARLAKHWANLANAQNVGNYPTPDSQQVLASLKEQGLLAGTLSTGDPAGYLFATRLAGELENARNDELRLPMSPDQYAALEKGLVEYIVKWGQKRISRGVTRIVIELSFEQALNAVSFNVSSLFRLPYKVLKASIKIPYNVNKVNNYTMPGHDKPYKAIYGLLGKKLKQLGFNLLTAPVPGTIKLAAGAGLTAGAASHNVYVGRSENTFSAVYQHVVEGKQSEKIKMGSVGGMIFDSVFDTATTAAFKGAQRGWQSGRSENNVISGNAFVSKHVAESNEETPRQAQRNEMAAGNDNSPQENAAADEREAMPVSHSSPLQPQTDVEPLSDEHHPDADRPRVRRKRAAPSPQWHDNILSDATLQSGHFDFDRDIRYQTFSGEQKKQTYLHGIQFVLLQIQNDGRFPKHIRDNAYLARIGAKLLVPVDIKGHKLNNTIFLPDSRGTKSGVLIRLDSDIPYYYVDEGKDLLEDVRWAMPYNADKRERRFIGSLATRPRVITLPSGIDTLNHIRAGKVSFEGNFNYNNPDPMDIASLSAKLADTMETDYNLKGEIITNKLLISRAIAGAHIPDPGVTVTETEYHLEITWDKLTPAEYLRSFSRPFSTLSGEMQLVSSSIKGETIQETELHVHQAEYIGSWIDVTVGAITSFTPAGWVLNTAQSAADIAADLSEGKDPDPLAVAGLVVGCIPGGRIAAKVGKFTRIGGKVVEYGVMLGNKAVDLAIVGRSIKTAVDTGEPLAIYQAFLASGMSVKNSYDMARNMSSSLKLGITIEESASLEELEALQNDAPEYSTAAPVVRTFRVGSREMRGIAVNGEIEIFNENTRTREKGSKLHLLAYRLQNAGGGRRLPELFSNKIVIGEHTFKRVKYSQDKFNEMMRIAKTYTPTSNSTARIEKIQQDYRAGKEISHTPQHDYYNSLSLDEKIDLFNKPDTDAITRGVLAGKINESIANINLYETAKAADDWKASANKATDVVLAPQNIFLKGRAGECLPESVLMGWALQSGQDAKLAKKLMSIYSSPNVADDPLYKSLVELHADGNASKFSATAISDVKVSTLGDAESRLFPTENSSVRVDIPEHTMLLSKVNHEGKVKYVFYDPNYGLAYFDKYKDMLAFFKKKIEAYNTPENSTNFYPLDYSRLPDVKIKGRNLNEIINGEIPALYKQESVNLDGISPHESVYKMSGDKNYIKVNDNVYQVEWDQTMSTWRVFDPANTNRSRVTVPVKRDANGEWFRHSDTGLKGGGLFDEIKNNWLAGKKFKRLQDFTEVVELEANKWPPEPVNKNIHMIWIGTKNISEQHIVLSIEAAQKNPDYNTTIIYDSGIPGHESAKIFMAEKLNGSNVTLVDFRNKSYFPQLQQEPAFSYYEQAIRDKKYAQASDLLRLLVLKYEGGIYKDIDDVQVKGFGSLAFPKGIGVMREYASEAGKATAFPNTPIAATKNNSVVNRALELAVENYRRGETNVLKLAGPDVFTEALYQEMPGMRPQVLGQQLEQFELAKRQALGMPLEKPKSFADEQLTLQEKSKISRPYEAIRGLSGYVENGADHSWVSDIPGTSALGNSQSEVSATFEPAIFKQALTEFVSQQTAQGPGDPAYTSYQSAFNSLSESQEITLQQVNDLKHALSASGNDLVAQAKYQYALLAYLSGPRGIQLPIDINEIRNRIVQKIEHADYVYGWKVKERDNYQAQLNKAIGEQSEIRRRYPVTLQPQMHVNADRKVVNLRNEVAERNRLMNEWVSKKNQASLQLDMWNDTWHESYD